MKKFKLRKADLHKSLPNLNLETADFDDNTLSSTYTNGSTINVNGHTEITKENGHSIKDRIPLKIILPNHKTTVTKKMDANTPNMDVLMDITKTNGINPGDMYLKLSIDRPPGYLNYKPNAPNGSLNCNGVEIAPKFDVCEKARKQTLQKTNTSYEPTIRIQVDLPKKLKRVFRVPSRLSLYELHRRICEETKYESDYYELRTYACPTIPLDLRSTLADCETAHFLLISSKANLSKSTGDIFSLYAKMPVEGKEKQRKSRGGLFRFFRRKRRKPSLDGATGNSSSAASTLDYNNGKALRDKTNHQARPLSLQFDVVTGLIDEDDNNYNDIGNGSAPGQTHAEVFQQHQQRNVKKRPAPKPPVLLETDQTRTNGEKRQQLSTAVDYDDVDDAATAATAAAADNDDGNESEHSPFVDAEQHRHTIVVDDSAEVTTDNHITDSHLDHNGAERPHDYYRYNASQTFEPRSLQRIPSENLIPEDYRGESVYTISGYYSGNIPTNREKPNDDEHNDDNPLPPSSYDKLEHVVSNYSVDRTSEKCNDSLQQLPEDSMTEPIDLTIISSSSRRTSRSSSPATAEEVHQNFKEVIEQMEAEISASDNAKDVYLNNFPQSSNKIFALYHDKTDNDLIDSDHDNFDYIQFITAEVRPSHIYIEPEEENVALEPNNDLRNVSDTSELNNLESTRLSNDLSAQRSDVEARIDRLIFDKSDNSKSHSSTIDSLLSTTDLGLNDEWEPVGRARLSADEPTRESAVVHEPHHILQSTNNVDDIVTFSSQPVLTGLEDGWEPKQREQSAVYRSEELAENVDNESNRQSLPQTTTTTESIEIYPSKPVHTGLNDDWEPPGGTILVDRKPPLPESPPPDADELALHDSTANKSTKSPSYSRERHSFKNLPPAPTSLTSIESPLKLSIVDLADQSSSTVSSPRYRRDYSSNSATMSPLPCQPLSPQSTITVKDTKRPYPAMKVKNFEEEYYAKQMNDEYLHEIKYGYVDPDERPTSKRAVTPPVRSPPKPSPVATATWSPSSHPQQRISRNSRAEISVTVGGPQTIKNSPSPSQIQQQNKRSSSATSVSHAEQTFVATPVRAVNERDELLLKEYEKLQTMFALWQERLKNNEAIVKRGGKLSPTDILEFQRVQAALMDQHQLVQKLCPVDDNLQDLKNVSDENRPSAANLTSPAATTESGKRNVVVTATVSEPVNGANKHDTTVSQQKEAVPFRHQRTVDVIRSSRTPGGGEDSEYEQQQRQQRANELRYTNGQLIDADNNENRLIDTSGVLKPSQLFNARKLYVENKVHGPVVVNRGFNEDNNKNVAFNNSDGYSNQQLSMTTVIGNKEDIGLYNGPPSSTVTAKSNDYGSSNMVTKTIFMTSPSSTLGPSSGLKHYVEIPSGGSFVTQISFPSQYELVENRTTTRQYDVRRSDSNRPTDVVKRERESFYQRNQQYVIPPPPPPPLSVSANPNFNTNSVVVDTSLVVADDASESREDLLRSIRDFGGAGHLKRAV